MSFPALESRINASVMNHLSNAQALFDGMSSPVPGIFKRAYIQTSGGMGMATNVPTFRLASTDVPASPVGKRLQIASVAYAVAEVEPDGTGLSLLILERTA